MARRASASICSVLGLAMLVCTGCPKKGTERDPRADYDEPFPKFDDSAFQPLVCESGEETNLEEVRKEAGLDAFAYIVRFGSERFESIRGAPCSPSDTKCKTDWDAA